MSAAVRRPQSIVDCVAIGAQSTRPYTSVTASLCAAQGLRRFSHILLILAFGSLPLISTAPVTGPVCLQSPTDALVSWHPVPCVDGSELARKIFTLGRWSVPPCVRPFDAVHMTAGHNALRGSGPGQIPAFDNAVALVGPRAPQPAHRRGAAPAPLTIASAVRAVEDGHVP
jgi:hypothetical protein